MSTENRNIKINYGAGETSEDNNLPAHSVALYCKLAIRKKLEETSNTLSLRIRLQLDGQRVIRTDNFEPFVFERSL